MTTRAAAASGATRAMLRNVAAEVGAEDLFVFRKVSPETFTHFGGVGRGEGWAGNIELRLERGGALPVPRSSRARHSPGLHRTPSASSAPTTRAVP